MRIPGTQRLQRNRAQARSSAPRRERGLRVSVLPFLAGEDEELAFAVSQGIATELEQFCWFDVVSPSSLSDRGVAVDTIDRSRRPKSVDYLLEGAIYRDGKHAHLTLRLLDLDECARSVWSEGLVLPVSKLPGWRQ